MADTVMEFRSSMTRELAPIELALIGVGPIHRFRVPGSVPAAKTVGARVIRTESLLESLAAGRPVFFTLGAAAKPATLWHASSSQYVWSRQSVSGKLNNVSDSRQRWFRQHGFGTRPCRPTLASLI